MPWCTTTMAGGFSILAKREDVGASSRKLDHHALISNDDQSPTFSSFFFSFRFPVEFSVHPPSENLCIFTKSTSSLAFGSSSLPQTLEFGRALSGVSVMFLFMLSSTNIRVWESLEKLSTLSSANVRVWESLELYFCSVSLYALFHKRSSLGEP